MILGKNAIKIHKQDERALIPIKQILSEHKTFDDELYRQLLSVPAFGGQDPYSKEDRFPSIFLSDEDLLLRSLEADFPEIIQLGSVGQSLEGRPMKFAKVDARKFLVTKRLS